MDNQSTTPPPTPPQGPTMPENPPPPPPSVPSPGSEPIPPKVQQHLDNNPHANEPVKPHHTKKFYSLLIFMIVVLLLIAGGLTWYLLVGSKAAAPVTSNQIVAPIATPTITPTPDPTANWKAYVSSASGLSMKYPNDMKVDEHEENRTVFISIAPTTEKNDLKSSHLFQIRVFNYAKTVDDYIEAECDNGSCGKPENAIDMKLSNQTAKRINLPSPTDSESVLFKVGAKLFIAEIVYNDTRYDEMYDINKKKELFTSIVSTIAVTDAASSISAEGTVSPTP